jgi:glycosyltransferase involved in cell wall biosynthesis
MSGLASLEAAWPLGVPVVQTFHALGTVKRRYQGAKDGSPPERIPAEVALAARADWIIATCTDEVRELEALGADGRRISVVPCGVDTSLFTYVGPLADRLPGVGRIAAVGRLVERKGVDDLIRALEAVPAVELVVAGGPARDDLPYDPDARRLAGVAASCGVADRVRLLGRVDRADLPALLRSADVVACTPWYEPFGIVPLEAMACQVPVVASKIGGLIDTVRDGVTGIHVPPGDPGALAAVLRQLLADPGLRARMGRAGRGRAVARYQWSDVAAATLAAYEMALRMRKTPDEVALR